MNFLLCIDHVLKKLKLATAFQACLGAMFIAMLTHVPRVYSQGSEASAEAKKPLSGVVLYAQSTRQFLTYKSGENRPLLEGAHWFSNIDGFSISLGGSGDDLLPKNSPNNHWDTNTHFDQHFISETFNPAISDLKAKSDFPIALVIAGEKNFSAEPFFQSLLMAIKTPGSKLFGRVVHVFFPISAQVLPQSNSGNPLLTKAQVILAKVKNQFANFENTRPFIFSKKIYDLQLKEGESFISGIAPAPANGEVESTSEFIFFEVGHFTKSEPRLKGSLFFNLTFGNEAKQGPNTINLSDLTFTTNNRARDAREAGDRIIEAVTNHASLKNTPFQRIVFACTGAIAPEHFGLILEVLGLKAAQLPKSRLLFSFRIQAVVEGVMQHLKSAEVQHSGTFKLNGPISTEVKKAVAEQPQTPVRQQRTTKPLVSRPALHKITLPSLGFSFSSKLLHSNDPQPLQVSVSKGFGHPKYEALEVSFGDGGATGLEHADAIIDKNNVRVVSSTTTHGGVARYSLVIETNRGAGTLHDVFGEARARDVGKAYAKVYAQGLEGFYVDNRNIAPRDLHVTLSVPNYLGAKISPGARDMFYASFIQSLMSHITFAKSDTFPKDMSLAFSVGIDAQSSPRILRMYRLMMEWAGSEAVSRKLKLKNVSKSSGIPDFVSTKPTVASTKSVTEPSALIETSVEAAVKGSTTLDYSAQEFATNELLRDNLAALKTIFPGMGANFGHLTPVEQMAILIRYMMYTLKFNPKFLGLTEVEAITMLELMKERGKHSFAEQKNVTDYLDLLKSRGVELQKAELATHKNFSARSLFDMFELAVRESSKLSTFLRTKRK